MNSRTLRLRLLRLAGRIRTRQPLPAQPRSVLIIRPDHLGDLILAAPALPLLREAYPRARFTAWLGPWGEPVWRHATELDEIELCAFPGFTRAVKRNPLAPYLLAAAAARGLAGRFDMAINLRFDFWWGAMAGSWAGIPVAGYDIPECMPFLSLAAPYAPGRHETDQNLDLVRFVTGGTGAAALPHLFPIAPASRPGAIGIHPGAGAEVKLWQEQRWAQVADELAHEGPIVLTAGSPDEIAMAERIRALMRQPAKVLSGISLDDLAALYRGCRLVLGPDCGPLHVARAVGTATVALFGPTNPIQFGPDSQGDCLHEVVRLRWQCVPCERLDYTPDELTYHQCVKLIEPQQVLDAARRVLMAQASRSSRNGLISPLGTVAE